MLLAAGQLGVAVEAEQETLEVPEALVVVLTVVALEVDAVGVVAATTLVEELLAELDTTDAAAVEFDAAAEELAVDDTLVVVGEELDVTEGLAAVVVEFVVVELTPDVVVDELDVVEELVAADVVLLVLELEAAADVEELVVTVDEFEAVEGVVVADVVLLVAALEVVAEVEELAATDVVLLIEELELAVDAEELAAVVDELVAVVDELVAVVDELAAVVDELAAVDELATVDAVLLVAELEPAVDPEEAELDGSVVLTAAFANVVPLPVNVIVPALK